MAAPPLLTHFSELGLAPVRHHYMGSLAERHCYAVEIADAAITPEGLTTHALRGLYGKLEEDLFLLAGRATQILTWDRTHQFCGQCGTPTQHLAGERARKCPNCSLTCYPRLSPAVIVLVTRGDELLLVRGHNFPEAFYSLVAGFVEPGESLEEAVTREVHEEVGLELKDIQYFGSQPWPFPHQVMVGFNATWSGGEIRVEKSELADARWFTRQNLPRIPPKGLSISRWLIDAFVEGQ